MTNKDLAEKIYEELFSEGISNDDGLLIGYSEKTIPLLSTILDKYNPEKEWQKLALAGLKNQATKSLWNEEAGNKSRNLGDIIQRVDSYIAQNNIEVKEN